MDVTATVTVYPEEGEFPRIARALLAVADSPAQVQVVSHPQMGFVVPEEVFDRFQAAEQADWEAGDDSSVTSDPAPQADLVTPKRRGRPRKHPLPEEKVEEQ